MNKNTLELIEKAQQQSSEDPSSLIILVKGKDYGERMENLSKKINCNASLREIKDCIAFASNSYGNYMTFKEANIINIITTIRDSLKEIRGDEYLLRISYQTHRVSRRGKISIGHNLFFVIY